MYISAITALICASALTYMSICNTQYSIIRIRIRIRNAFIRQVEIQRFLREFVVVVDAYIQHWKQKHTNNEWSMGMSGYLQHRIQNVSATVKR